MQVVLRDKLDPEAEDAPNAVTAFLERRIEDMVKKAAAQRASPQAPKLPLVRLRVRLTSVSATSPTAKRLPFKHCAPMWLLQRCRD